MLSFPRSIWIGFPLWIGFGCTVESNPKSGTSTEETGTTNTGDDGGTTNEPAELVLQEAANVCEADTNAVVLSWEAIDGASYTLEYGLDGESPNPVSVSDGATDATLPGPLAAGSYSWTVTASVGGEVVAQATGTFDVLPTPASPMVTGDTEVCEGGELALMATGEGTFTWTTPSGDTFEGDTFRFDGASSGTYSVTSTLNGCESAPAVVEITAFDSEVTVGQSTSAEFETNTSESLDWSNDQLSLAGEGVSWGDGSDGIFAPTASTTLPGGVYNFTQVDIPIGVTITVTGAAPLVIYSTGSIVIAGTLDASGANGSPGTTFSALGMGGLGVAGGGNGGDGTYSDSTGELPGANGSGTGAGWGGVFWSGGGGGAFGTDGGSASTTNGIGGTAYGTADLNPLEAGSGGGGGSGGNSCGSGGGGAGGGIIQLASPTISISGSGTLSVDGGDGGSDGGGNCGSGGGGSGGALWLMAEHVVVDGLVSAVGGIGGSSTIGGSPYYGVGGNGGEGRIRIDSADIQNNGAIEPSIGYTGAAYALFGDTTMWVQATQVCSWGNLRYTSNTPAGAVLAVDIVDEMDAVLVSDVLSGSDLSSIPALEGRTAFGLHFQFASDDGSQTPVVSDWSVSYIGQ